MFKATTYFAVSFENGEAKGGTGKSSLKELLEIVGEWEINPGDKVEVYVEENDYQYVMEIERNGKPTKFYRELATPVAPDSLLEYRPCLRVMLAETESEALAEFEEAQDDWEEE